MARRSRIGSESTEALIRIMTDRGYWLVIRDAQMWEASFRRHGESVWEGLLWKSCSVDTAIVCAAALVLFDHPELIGMGRVARGRRPSQLRSPPVDPKDLGHGVRL